MPCPQLAYQRPEDFLPLLARLKGRENPDMAVEGRVRAISPDAFEKNSANGADGARLLYRIRVAVDKTELSAVPKDFRLIPGMGLSAEIKIGARRVITYLLYPIIRSFDETMREP